MKLNRIGALVAIVVAISFLIYGLVYGVLIYNETYDGSESKWVEAESKWLEVNTLEKSADKVEKNGKNTISSSFFIADMEILINLGDIISYLASKGIHSGLNKAQGRMLTQQSKCISDYEANIVRTIKNNFTDYQLINDGNNPSETPLSYRRINPEKRLLYPYENIHHHLHKDLHSSSFCRNQEDCCP